jgi:hypothetical protein
MKCHVCNKPATHRLTPDLDIKGIPWCGDKECRDKINLELMIRIYESTEAHKDRKP